MDFPTQERFEEWLGQQEPTKIVGRANEHSACPLAAFLRHEGAMQPYIRPDRVASGSCWRTDDGTAGQALPAWANAFARLVDRFNDDGVEARDALYLLRGARGQTL